MAASRARPPRPARWLLELCRLGARRAEIEGDLAELFVLRSATLGPRRAAWLYCRDVLSVWIRPPFARDRGCVPREDSTAWLRMSCSRFACSGVSLAS